MKTLIFLLFMLGSISAMDAAQSSGDLNIGALKDNVYTNPGLGITWEIPKEWTADNQSKPLLGADFHLLIHVLANGGQSPESIEFASSSSTNAANADRALQDKGWEHDGQIGYYSLGGGISIHRSNYRSKAEPAGFLALLSGERKGNLLVLIYQADSAARVDELVRASLRMKVQPDWGTLDESVPAPQPGSRPRKVRVSQLVSQKLLEEKVDPIYPKAALKAHVQGMVVMLANISAQGNIKNLFVLSGDPLLAPAAIEAVSQWQYKPYILDGEAFDIETQISVNFAFR